MQVSSDNRRLRFLLNPMGTAGDVHPYLGIAVEMIARGHEAFVLTNSAFEPVAERLAIPFVPIGEKVDWSTVGSNRKVHNFWSHWKESMSWGAITPMRETYGHFERLNRPKVTCIVSPVWSFAARNAHDALGMPHANCVINPMVMRSAYASPKTPMMYMPAWMPRWTKRYQYWYGDRFFIDPVLKPELNRFRRELGLPPVARLMHRWWFSPQLVLGLFETWMVPRQKDWAANVEFVGHPRWDPPGDVSDTESAECFAKAGDPPILFVPGSVGPGGKDFFQFATDAVATLGFRAIFLDRNDQFIPQDLPPSVRHFQYVQLGRLAPLCKAIVHSGCAGTLSHALAAGIPHVIWPRVNDQFDNAARLERLQIGKSISTKMFSQLSLQAALTEILSRPIYQQQAKFYAAKMANRKPLASLCDQLEQFMNSEPQIDSDAVPESASQTARS